MTKKKAGVILGLDIQKSIFRIFMINFIWSGRRI